jgi:hypothetical protein
MCLFPLLAILTSYLVKFIKMKSEDLKAKTKNEKINKYIDLLSNTISTCVIATNQTYVEALKKNNAFTKEAQQEAFELTYSAVLSVLNEEAKFYLTEIYGDLYSYIGTRIEAEVNKSKA